MADVLWTPVAEQDLAEIWWSIEPDNLRAADKLLQLINRTCALLAEHPHMGRRRDGIFPGLISFPVGNYVIFYRPSPSGIEVARVLHGARDLPSLFRD